MPSIHNAAVAAYCADPDVITGCLELCADPGVSAIGLRVGSYLQATAFFAMTLLAPDEGGAESMWVALSIGYSFLVTAFIQLWQGNMTSHHATVAFLLAMLPYIGTMSGMNSITAYRGLGAFGMRALQVGLVLKTLLAGVLWGLIINSFFNGQPPSWTGFEFRQPGCFDSTALVSFLIPIKPSDARTALDTAILVLYSIFWFLLLLLGSNWTLRAPTFLRRNGEPILNYHYRHHFFPANGSIEEKRANLEAHPYDYTPDNTSDDEFISFRSLPKTNSLNPQHAPPPSAPAPSGKKPAKARIEGAGVDATEESADSSATGDEAVSGPALYGANSWSHVEAKVQKEFYVWPAVAVLLIFTIASVELQIGLNDIYEGEMELDFPGTLSMLLTVPTMWAAFKAARLIYLGNRPPPTARALENFYEMEGADQAAIKRRRRETYRAQGGMRHMAVEKREAELGVMRSERKRLGKMRRRRRGVTEAEPESGSSSDESERESRRRELGGVSIYNL